MDEIISYKMCAVKVRNAKLRNYLNYLLVFAMTVCVMFCQFAVAFFAYKIN
jgi:succinate dehydrogenase hydrophobic anchor subunit